MSKTKKLNEELGNALLNEEWKPVIINGEDTNHLVSNLGKVMNRQTGTILVPMHLNRKDRKVNDSYDLVMLDFHVKDKDDKIVRRHLLRTTHRLVAEAFIPNPENKPQVNHKDGNKHNNAVSNLEWVTQSENIQHAIRTGLMEPPGKGAKSRHAIYTEADVHRVCKVLEERPPISEVAKRCNVSEAFVIGIYYNKSWEDIRSQYKIPEPVPRIHRTPEQMEIVKRLVDQGERNRRYIIKSAGMEYDKTNVSYVKYIIRLANGKLKKKTS